MICQYYFFTQELRELVGKCLSRANKDKCRTISFPVLGSGKLKYPPQKVASVLLDASMTFSKTAKKLYLEFIRFIIHPDQTNVIEVMPKMYKYSIQKIQKLINIIIFSGFSNSFQNYLIHSSRTTDSVPVHSDDA